VRVRRVTRHEHFRLRTDARPETGDDSGYGPAGEIELALSDVITRDVGVQPMERIDAVTVDSDDNGVVIQTSLQLGRFREIRIQTASEFFARFPPRRQ